MCRAAASSTESLGSHGEQLAEVKAQLRIGVPVAFSAVLRRSMTVWTVGFVGQLGSKAMAAAALANSTTNTFALSIMVGLSSASVTLVSQAVGAKDSRQAGLWLHRALLVHALTAVPLTLFLLCFAPLLVAVGQDADLAAAAGEYAGMLVPAMWAWAAMWALQPWLQAHGVVRVQTATSAVAALLHPCLLALLVPRGGLVAAAAVDSASTSTSVLLLALSVALVARHGPSLPSLGAASARLLRLLTARLVMGGPGQLGRPDTAPEAAGFHRVRARRASPRAGAEAARPAAIRPPLPQLGRAPAHIPAPRAAGRRQHVRVVGLGAQHPRLGPAAPTGARARRTLRLPGALAMHAHTPCTRTRCAHAHARHTHICIRMHVHTCHALRHGAHACTHRDAPHRDAPTTQTVNAVCFMLPLGASVAGATRVGQALGRGDARAARRAAAAALALGVCAALGAAALLLLLRGVLPAAFTRDQEVRALVRSLLPPLALYVVADASQARS